MRQKAFGNIIYDNFVFDVPKLMDLCILYGFQNKAILTKMIKNIFSAQPRYTEDLTETCNFVLHVSKQIVIYISVSLSMCFIYLFSC